MISSSYFLIFSKLITVSQVLFLHKIYYGKMFLLLRIKPFLFVELIISRITFQISNYSYFPFAQKWRAKRTQSWRSWLLVVNWRGGAMSLWMRLILMCKPSWRSSLSLSSTSMISKGLSLPCTSLMLRLLLIVVVIMYCFSRVLLEILILK